MQQRKREKRIQESVPLPGGGFLVSNERIRIPGKMMYIAGKKTYEKIDSIKSKLENNVPMEEKLRRRDFKNSVCEGKTILGTREKKILNFFETVLSDKNLKD